MSQIITEFGQTIIIQFKQAKYQIVKLEQGKRLRILSQNIDPEQLIGYYSGITLQLSEDGKVQQVQDLNYLDYTCTEKIDDDLDEEEFILNEKAQQCLQNKQTYQDRTSFSQQKKAKQARDKYSNIFQIKINNPYLHAQYLQNSGLQTNDYWFLSGSDLGYIMQQAAFNPDDKSVLIWDEFQGLGVANAAQRMYNLNVQQIQFLQDDIKQQMQQLLQQVESLLIYKNESVNLKDKQKVLKMMFCEENNKDKLIQLQEQMKDLYQIAFNQYKNKFNTDIIYTSVGQMQLRKTFNDVNIDWNKTNCINIQPERFNQKSLELLMHQQKQQNKQEENESELKRKIYNQETLEQEIKFQQILVFDYKISQEFQEFDHYKKIMKSQLIQQDNKQYRLLTPNRIDNFDITSKLIKETKINMPEKLLILSKSRPLLLVQSLINCITSGSPIVIYHQYIEYLTEVSEYLQLTKLGLKLKICELREQKWQILPNRTHPEMLGQISNGYILTGWIVTP